MKKRLKRRYIATVGVVLFALLSLVVETSLACLREGSGPIAMAEDCCQSQCHHSMRGDVASSCCQNHRTQVSQAILPPSLSKVSSVDLTPLLAAFVRPVVLQHDFHSLLPYADEHPPPFHSLYRLHCIFLI